MSALDDILDDAKFDGDAESTTDDVKPASESKNSSFKDLRDHARKLERSNKQFEKELEELRAFRAEVETERRYGALTEAGLNKRQGEAFLKLYDEVTPENISAFRAEVLGAEVDDTPAVTFVPSAVGGEAPRKTYSRQEFEAIMRSDPAKGRAIMAANLVTWEHDATGGRGF